MSGPVFENLDWPAAVAASVGYYASMQEVDGRYLNILNIMGYFPVLSTLIGPARVIRAGIETGSSPFTALQTMRGMMEVSGFGPALLVLDVGCSILRGYVPLKKE